MAGKPRIGVFSRRTQETRVELRLGLDGSLDKGAERLKVPDGFFGHMLDAFVTHGRLAVDLDADGDVHVDLHHTVEDVGIGFGAAVREALADRSGIERWGHAYAPLDEALVRAVIDLSGRGSCQVRMPSALEQTWVTRDFPLTLIVDFFQAFADHAGLTLHLDVLHGRSPHHVAEASFKAVAVALRRAVARTDAAGVPSTKGTLV